MYHRNRITSLSRRITRLGQSYCHQNALNVSHHMLSTLQRMPYPLDGETKAMKNEQSRTQQRPLYPQDQMFFDKSLALPNFIMIFPLKSFSCWFGMTHSDSKLKLAFQEVVRNNLLLQTKIVGEGQNATFKRLLASDADNPSNTFPSLKIEPKVEDSEEGMIQRAKSILAEKKAMYASKGQDAYRYPINLTAVRGPDDVAFVGVTPHPFFDAGACGSFFGQLYMNQLLPRGLWPLAEMLQVPKELPPSFNEVVFKRKLPKKMDSYEEIDVFSDTCLSPRYAKGNFEFEDYDADAPGATSQLRGYEGGVVSVSVETLTECVDTLKKDGVTLTSAFDALAVKVLAKLIMLNKEKTVGVDDAKVHDPLIIWTSIDGRKMNLVPSNAQGDKKEKTQGNLGGIFPLIGNYSFAHLTQVSFEDALTSPMENIARKAKEGVDRLRTDENYRLHHVASLANRTSDHIMYRCGATCFRMPAILQKINLNVRGPVCTNEWGPVPRCLFWVVGHSSNTKIHANIKLPLPAIDEDIVRQTILEVVKGSTLERLFSELYE